MSGCLAMGVSQLVYTSTIDVVIGNEPIINGDEKTPIPKPFLFPGYPDTKYKGEQLVVQAHGKPLATGESFLMKRQRCICMISPMQNT